MRFKFTGKYTNGHTAVSIHGITFEGYEPTEVADEEIVAKLRGHPEVEAVAGRPPKAKD